jgi:hypothetical protein
MKDFPQLDGVLITPTRFVIASTAMSMIREADSSRDGTSDSTDGEGIDEKAEAKKLASEFVQDNNKALSVSNPLCVFLSPSAASSSQVLDAADSTSSTSTSAITPRASSLSVAASNATSVLMSRQQVAHHLAKSSILGLQLALFHWLALHCSPSSSSSSSSASSMSSSNAQSLTISSHVAQVRKHPHVAQLIQQIVIATQLALKLPYQPNQFAASLAASSSSSSMESFDLVYAECSGHAFKVLSSLLHFDSLQGNVCSCHFKVIIFYVKVFFFFLIRCCLRHFANFRIFHLEIFIILA